MERSRYNFSECEFPKNGLVPYCQFFPNEAGSVPGAHKMSNETDRATAHWQHEPLNDVWKLYEDVTSALIERISARLETAEERLQILAQVNKANLRSGASPRQKNATA